MKGFGTTLLLAFTLLVAVEAEADPGAVEITRATKVRAQGRLIGVLNEGEVYVARQERDGRLRVDFAGGSVWLPWSSVKPAESSVLGIGAKVAGMSVKASPSAGAARLGSIGTDQRYVRIGGEGSWIKIRFRGDKIGWVYAPLATSGKVDAAKAPVDLRTPQDTQRQDKADHNHGLAGGVTSTLTLGQRGEAIKRLQEKVNMRRKAMGLAPIREDGVVDQATLQALRSNDRGTSATNRQRRGGSIFGAGSRGGGNAAPALTLGGESIVAPGSGLSAELPTLEEGDQGSEVRIFQTLLNDVRRRARQPEIFVNGVMDGLTMSALADFQQSSFQSSSGKTDAQTWAALMQSISVSHPLGTIQPLFLPRIALLGRHTSRQKDAGLYQWPASSDPAHQGKPRPLLYESKLTIRTQAAEGLDAARVPFVVVPSDFAKHAPGFKPYDLACVIVRGRVAYGYCVPVGSAGRIGEASQALAHQLGLRAGEDLDGGAITLVFAGTSSGGPQAADEVDRKGAMLLKALGGRE
ncbi:MAG TPA: hypothetical protein DEA08_13925 [Planctomycetes bacterium]|nr:hypothetical protein [Planctomycetota bacterium]